MAVSDVMESLMAYPESFPVVYRQTRRVNLPRFRMVSTTELLMIKSLWLPVCTDGETPDGGNLVTNGLVYDSVSTSLQTLFRSFSRYPTDRLRLV